MAAGAGLNIYKIGAYSSFGIFFIKVYLTWINSSDTSAPNKKYVALDADKNNSVSPASIYDNFWYFHSDPLINYRVSMHKWLKYKNNW